MIISTTAKKSAALTLAGYKRRNGWRAIQIVSRVALVLRWLRRCCERDDQHHFKAAIASPVDPIEELIRVVNEAQERDAEDERRLYPPLRGFVPRQFNGGAQQILETARSKTRSALSTRKRARSLVAAMPPSQTFLSSNSRWTRPSRRLTLYS
jgi:hypothetical protein